MLVNEETGEEKTVEEWVEELLESDATDAVINDLIQMMCIGMDDEGLQEMFSTICDFEYELSDNTMDYLKNMLFTHGDFVSLFIAQAMELTEYGQSIIDKMITKMKQRANLLTILRESD